MVNLSGEIKWKGKFNCQHCCNLKKINYATNHQVGFNTNVAPNY